MLLVFPDLKEKVGLWGHRGHQVPRVSQGFRASQESQVSLVKQGPLAYGVCQVPWGPRGRLGTKVCQGSPGPRGCLDQRENQESQGTRVYRAPQASQVLQALVAPLDHLEFQVPKGNRDSQGPLGSPE